MVKMKTSTYYEGKHYRKDEEYSVDEKTEERWIKNGIATSQDQPLFSGISEDKPKRTTKKQSQGDSDIVL